MSAKVENIKGNRPIETSRWRFLQNKILYILSFIVAKYMYSLSLGIENSDI